MATTSPRRSRVGPWPVLILAGIGIVGVAFTASINPSHLPDGSRHVQSTIVTLAKYGDDSDPIWMYITSDRDIKIRPDGSGEISEHFVDRDFPTPAEASQWLSSDRAPYAGVNETFGPSELFFYQADQVRDGVGDPTLRFAPPGDALRRIASLLSETVPSEAVSEAALSTARGLNGADVKKVGSVVTISGETGDHLLRVTLAFETTPARLARETWDALVASTGLQLPPPYPTFDRTITMSESIVGY